MTEINAFEEQSNLSLDKKHNCLLRSSTTDSKDMKRVLSPNNILTSPKTVKGDDSEMVLTRKKSNDHLNALKAHQEVSRRMKEDSSEKRDRMKDLDYNIQIAHQSVARMKIVDIK